MSKQYRYGSTSKTFNVECTEKIQKWNEMHYLNDYSFHGWGILFKEIFSFLSKRILANELLLFDKADYLGDRIAIMSKGSLRCCGLPLYLKSKYGSGYSLVLTRKSFEKNLDYDFDDTTNKITDLVRSVIPNSHLESNINFEMKFLLSSVDSDKFPALFDRLEKLKDHLNLINVGISATTIEQVFLK